MTKDDVYKLVAESATFGNLGLFIGAGFSLAVNESSFNFEPLSWIELLKSICRDNEITWDSNSDGTGKITPPELQKEFASCPEVASQICKIISRKAEVSLAEATNMFKKQVCNITSWYSNKSQRDIYGKILKSLLPNWIVTTNYDLILETLLPEESVSLSPRNEFVFNRSKIPIFHLHGVCTDFETIIITNEDYIALSRPHNYRMERLSLMFSESTTLMIGYSIGDPNVLTALDWSKNVYDEQVDEAKKYPHAIIQLVYTETPKYEPYETDNGIIILETNSIKVSLGKMISLINEFKETQKLKNDELNSLREKYLNPTVTDINDFLTNIKKRHEILKEIIEQKEIVIATETYLSEIFKTAWKKTEPSGAFDEYSKVLDIFLDIFKTFELKKFPPSIYMLFVSNFEKLSFYINDIMGTSYKAFENWKQNKDSIAEENKKEISGISSWNWNIKKLLKRSNFSN